MFQITQRFLAGVALTALPLTFITGCGGGSGGGSPLPTSTPRPTTTPTTPPVADGQSYNLIAAFSNIKGDDIPSAFISNKGEGSFTSQGFFGAGFKRIGAEGYLLNMALTTGLDTIEEGESIVLPNGLDDMQLTKILIYYNPVTKRRFVSQSGTVKIEKITPVTGPTGLKLTRVKFQILNAVMLPNDEADLGKRFTINATGETTSPITKFED